MSPRPTIHTYRALPPTRRSAMIDYFRHRALRLPDTPMPHYTFTHDNHGCDYELFTKIPAPSPIKNKAEAYEQAKMWCDTQNQNWRKLYADWNATEKPLDLFPAYLEPQDCYPVYSPNTVDWVLYWQVNYRVMLPTVRVGREQFRAAVQGEYVRIGVYHDAAIVTLNYHHFPVEELSREPYFFAPKAEEEKVPPSEGFREVAKMANAPQNEENTVISASALGKKAAEADAAAFDATALILRKVGDVYSGFAATPQGYVAASRSGVAEREEEEKKDVILYNNEVFNPKMVVMC